MPPTDQNAFLAWLAANGPGIFVIVVVLGTLFILVVAAKKLWPGVRGAVLVIDALVRLPAHMDETTEHFKTLDASMNAVKHEVLPNSGNSLRDQVDKLGVVATATAKTAKSTAGTVRSQGRRLKGIEESLEMTQQPEAVQHARARARRNNPQA